MNLIETEMVMDISSIYWLLIAVGFSGMVLLIVFRLVQLWKLRPGAASSSGEEIVREGTLPEGGSRKVSVVVYSQTSENELKKYLRELFSQDYPDFEVVVVLDTDEADHDSAASRINDDYPDVHVTFVPVETYHLSRRKLAFTLGVKAAEGEFVVITSPMCRIQSRSWLNNLVAPLISSPDCVLSLGLCVPNRPLESDSGRWYRSFDYLLATSRWISAAANNRPYRGNIFNMAFRRDKFFEIDGFASSNFLHTGDDDLFVCQMSRCGDTAMLAADADARLVYSPVASPRKQWTVDKAQHDFTSRYLPRSPFLKGALASWGCWLSFAGCVCAMILSANSPIMMILPGLLLLILWGLEIASCRRAARFLGINRLWWSVPPFMLCYPIANRIFRMRHRQLMRLCYTWRR